MVMEVMNIGHSLFPRQKKREEKGNTCSLKVDLHLERERELTR